MKEISLFLVFAGIILINAPLTNAAASNKIETFLLEKCKRNSPDAVAHDNVKKHLGQLVNYMKYAFSHLPDAEEQYCEEERFVLVKYFGLLIRDMKPCLVQEEQYLRNFTYYSFAHFAQIFLCEDNGKNIKNFFSILAQNCTQAFKTAQGGKEVKACFNQIIPAPDGILRKEKLCNDMEIARKCFRTSIDKHCPNLMSFQSLNDQFFDAIKDPCNNAPSSTSLKTISLIAFCYLISKVIMFA